MICWTLAVSKINNLLEKSFYLFFHFTHELKLGLVQKATHMSETCNKSHKVQFNQGVNSIWCKCTTYITDWYSKRNILRMYTYIKVDMNYPELWETIWIMFVHFIFPTDLVCVHSFYVIQQQIKLKCNLFLVKSFDEIQYVKQRLKM